MQVRPGISIGAPLRQATKILQTVMWHRLDDQERKAGGREHLNCGNFACNNLRTGVDTGLQKRHRSSRAPIDADLGRRIPRFIRNEIPIRN